MSKNYYPWNVSALMDWLEKELSNCKGSSELADKLQIPSSVLQRWTQDLYPDIALKHIQAIAKYRGWSVPDTVEWLEIKAAHWQQLVEEDVLQL